jgi:hypothetical protein
LSRTGLLRKSKVTDRRRFPFFIGQTISCSVTALALFTAKSQTFFVFDRVARFKQSQLLLDNFLLFKDGFKKTWFP